MKWVLILLLCPFFTRFSFGSHIRLQITILRFLIHCLHHGWSYTLCIPFYSMFNSSIYELQVLSVVSVFLIQIPHPINRPKQEKGKYYSRTTLETNQGLWVDNDSTRCLSSAGTEYILLAVCRRTPSMFLFIQILYNHYLYFTVIFYEKIPRAINTDLLLQNWTQE